MYWVKKVLEFANMTLAVAIGDRLEADDPTRVEKRMTSLYLTEESLRVVRFPTGAHLVSWTAATVIIYVSVPASAEQISAAGRCDRFFSWESPTQRASNHRNTLTSDAEPPGWTRTRS